MNDKILKRLDFLRLIDETGALSLTNITMMILMVRMAILPTLSLVDAAAVLTIMTSYSFKRFYQRKQRYTVQNNFKAAVTAPSNTEFLAMQEELNRIKNAVTISGVFNGKDGFSPR